MAPHDAPRDEALGLDWLQWCSQSKPSLARLRSLVDRSGKDWVGLDGCGALVWAMRQQRKKAQPFVRMLLDEGFDPSEPQSQVSPLFEACYQNDLKSLQLLLAANADPNPAHQACPMGQACLGRDRLPFIAALVQAGASVAPSSHFDGIVAEFSKLIDRFDRFYSGALWNGLADTLAPYPVQWQEFSDQMKHWADDHGSPRFVNEVNAWLSRKQAVQLASATPQPSSSLGSSRRI